MARGARPDGHRRALRLPTPALHPAPGPLPEDADQEAREHHREQELDYAAMREVRHTILRIFRNRLVDYTRWRDKDYDFTGVVFDGGDLSNACFTGQGKVSFAGARFTTGKFSFAGAEFRYRTRLDFTGAQFMGGEVSFAGTSFRGFTSFSGAYFNGAEVSFEHASFDRKADFDDTMFLGSQVSFQHARLHEGLRERATFTGATFSGGSVDFTHAYGWLPRDLKEAAERGSAGVVHLSQDWSAPPPT